MESKALFDSVQVVGEPWAESAYYEDAEKWTFLFWAESRPFHTLFQRLDLSDVLELACGYGRHAAITAERAGKLILMDIFEQNLERCRQRLASHDNVQYVLGNGFTFEPVEADSLTAIYCYDAMVHFSPDLVESYLVDAARVLQPGGQILLHHSNYDTQGNNQHYGLNPHARNHMTQELFSELAERAGLVIVERVPVHWGGVQNLDNLSLLQKP